MAYVPKIFKDRSVEFPGRRLLTEVVGSANTFDVTRAEGKEFEVGTMPDATNLNAEFDKIKTETDAINNSLTAEWQLIGTATGTTQINFVKADWKELKFRVLPSTAGAGVTVTLEKQIETQFLSDTRYLYGDAMIASLETNAYIGMMCNITTTYAKLTAIDVYTGTITTGVTVQLWGK